MSTLRHGTELRVAAGRDDDTRVEARSSLYIWRTAGLAPASTALSLRDLRFALARARRSAALARRAAASFFFFCAAASASALAASSEVMMVVAAPAAIAGLAAAISSLFAVGVVVAVISIDVVPLSSFAFDDDAGPSVAVDPSLRAFALVTRITITTTTSTASPSESAPLTHAAMTSGMTMRSGDGVGAGVGAWVGATV